MIKKQFLKIRTRLETGQQINFIVSNCIQFKKYIIITSKNMQAKKSLINPDLPVFNIRKVNKKLTNPTKNIGDYNCNMYEFDQLNNPQFSNNNYSSVNKGLNGRKQKQIILDQSVNQSIVNSKVYTDLKKTYLNNKKKNAELKKQLQEKILKKKQEKSQVLNQRERLQNEKHKYIQSIKAMKQKLDALRQTNQRYRQALSNRVSGEAQYISNLIMSMRFQAQYEHGIDPDQMTYQQLLQLEEKIGIVSRGLPPELIQFLPKIQVKQIKQEQKCTVCFSNYELGQIITKIFNCKHQFHFQCLESWLGKQKVCPICKQQIQFQTS